jgi:hypothetical protein
MHRPVAVREDAHGGYDTGTMRTTVRCVRLLLLLAGVLTGSALAGEADVVDVKVRRAAPGIYDFDITVKSVDKGWDYYADAFEELAPDGTLLGRRVLLHPHQTEQPFTRDLYGVKIPASVREVMVRARHKPKGYDGKTLRVRLTQ